MEMKGKLLAIDQGNTRIKLYLMEDGHCLDHTVIAGDDSDAIFSWIERWAPDAGIVCTVGRYDARLIESLRIAFDGRFMALSHSTPLPMEVKYSTPETLGLDRVALAVGGKAKYPDEGLAIADSGTALTTDVVTADGNYMGGRISPGIELRIKSLHEHTAALPLIDAEGDTPIAGYSTETSIRSGVERGLAGEIAATYKEYEKEFQVSRLILTGGDAGKISGLLPDDVSADIDEYLMAQGLYAIYDYNENTY